MELKINDLQNIFKPISHNHITYCPKSHDALYCVGLRLIMFRKYDTSITHSFVFPIMIDCRYDHYCCCYHNLIIHYFKTKLNIVLLGTTNDIVH